MCVLGCCMKTIIIDLQKEIQTTCCAKNRQNGLNLKSQWKERNSVLTCRTSLMVTKGHHHQMNLQTYHVALL